MSLTNAQYDTLMRKYEARQLQNQHILQERKEALYEKQPKLKELDDAISHASVTQARKLLSGDDAALNELKAQLTTLREEKQALLSSMHLPDDYLVPPYVCPDCKDTGFIDGKRCHCFEQASIDLIYTQSNIRRILEKENFKHFSFSYYAKDDLNPSTGKSSYDTAFGAVKTAKNFIRHFDDCFENLFLFGDTGVGKTFLSNCIAKELLDTGHSVIYLTAFELFDIFSRSTFQKDSDAIHANQNIFRCDLLIIDDLGTESSNSFTSSQFFLCINERLLREKSTIISTNLRPTQLTDLYSERTFSRISSNYRMLKLVGEDIRIKKKLLVPVHTEPCT